MAANGPHWRRWLIVSVAAAAVTFPDPASATTVVALLDHPHHRIVLADDGMVGQYYAGTTQPTCKLIVMPDCAFAMAGLLAKPQPYFRLQELGTSACEAPGSLREKADAFLNL